MIDKTQFEAKVRELERIAAISSMAVENLIGSYEGPEASRVNGNYANLLRFSVSEVERRVKALRAMI